MYGSGAIPSINRGNGGIPQMYGGVVPMYGNGQVPPPLYTGGMQTIPRVVYSPGAPLAPGGIPILYGNRRVLPTMYGNGRTVPSIYGNGRGPPPMYQNGHPPPSYRSGAGATMRGGADVYSGGQLRGAPVLYDSGAVPDHDGLPPPPAQHPGAPCEGECSAGEFACLGSCSCIPASWRCDGDADCVAEEDEVECGEELDEDADEECNIYDGNVRCPRTGRCIREEFLCDGEDDCGDFSDETHCGKCAHVGGVYLCLRPDCIKLPD